MKKLNPSRVGVFAATAALTVGLAAGPASAKKPTLKSLNKTLTSLQKTLKTVQKNVTAATKSASTANSGLAATNATLKNTNSALATLETAGGQAINAFTVLATAVENTTTGLPGLNAARPLVGAVVSNAAVPPTGGEITLTHGTAGTYVLHFVNGVGAVTDVSTRAVEVTLFAGVAGFASAANCSNAAATPACTAIMGSADSLKSDEFVTTFDNTGTAADENFQVAAISG